MSAQTLTVKEAAATLPIPVSVKTVRRWCTEGLKLKDGTVVKLRSRRVGARLVFERADLSRFMAAVNAGK